jgi:hypothetical protein
MLTAISEGDQRRLQQLAKTERFPVTVLTLLLGHGRCWQEARVVVIVAGTRADSSDPSLVSERRLSKER